MQNNISSTNSIGDVRIREAYDSAPTRKQPDFCIARMKEYANEPRTRDDSGSTKCATFEAFDYACAMVETISGIPHTKIYPGLRDVGYTIRYSDMKSDNPDALWDLGEVTTKCMATLDPGVMPFIRNSEGLFTDMKSVSYRINDSVIAVTAKEAVRAGVKVSELNLFNALAGLELLTVTDPDYFLLRDHLYVDESLTKFESIKKRLVAKRATLLKIIGD